MNQKPLRLVLSEAQAAVLDDHGSDHFILVHRPCRTEQPDIHQRWCITLAPMTTKTAKDVAAVLCGCATVRRTSKQPQAATVSKDGQPANTPATL